MAEISTVASEHKPGVRRSKKLSTRVDLTPMVDLGFLLITFFIFTTKIAETKRMELHLPVGKEATTAIGESTALTVILLDQSRIFYYHGQLKNALQANRFGITSYSMHDGIGSIIRQKQLGLDNTGMKRDELMLIIKPTANSRFIHAIDILDEVLINDLKHYAFVDVEDAEIAALAARNIKL